MTNKQEETEAQDNVRRLTREEVCERMREARKRGREKAQQTKTATAKQRHITFAREYLTNGQNATQAAIAAGYTPSAAAKAGYRLKQLDHVRSILDSARIEALESAKVDTDWVTERLRLEAETAKTDSARVKALELLGRITGAYAPERQDVTVEQHGFWSVAAGQVDASSGDEDED